MNFSHPFCPDISLFVKGRISPEDAKRQTATAAEILLRLEQQPGVVLADEVGMGKTFVALAVAASVALSDPQKRPVVVMVPSSLKEKWPQDFALFAEKCLPPQIRSQLRAATAEHGVDFLKCLDDPDSRRKSLVFLTHGAMSRSLTNGWVKLALIQRALYMRHGTEPLRRALCRCLGDLLQMKGAERRSPDIWSKLLSVSPEKWLKNLQRAGIDPENDNNPEIDDDPVPASLLEVLHDFNAGALYAALDQIPFRQGSNYNNNILRARHEINHEMKRFWDECVRNLRVKLPLLIMDEAHHLKNEKTRLASLFCSPDARDDAETLDSKGALGNLFERMLFLTATPFQLGHHELCSVIHRFESIAWDSAPPARMDRAAFHVCLDDLRSKPDAAQEASVSLDQEWGRLTSDDLLLDGRLYEDASAWWKALEVSGSRTPQAEGVWQRYKTTKIRMKEAEFAIKPWVLRHLKPKNFPGSERSRRHRIIGRAIIDDSGDLQGLPVGGQALLPFLLAARATVYRPDARPVFAEGLASCFESFIHTRRLNQQEIPLTDGDDEVIGVSANGASDQWYLDQLESLITRKACALDTHPKIAATVNRVKEIWLRGEKVLVFCHFVVTGRVLRRAISDAIHKEILKQAAASLGCSEVDALIELDRIGTRFFDVDSPLYRACDEEVRRIVGNFKSLDACHDDLVELAHRNIRTPAFLVRYFPLSEPIDEKAVAAAFRKEDASGLTLADVLSNFFKFLEERCGSDTRSRYLDAIKRIQTGFIAERDIAYTFSSDELEQGHENLIPNVRLVNGRTRQDTRQRLMLTFNTPFFPEILIASSVMAEGVDLHCHCRHVIHHDLCWNPSTLEQRTGRIDRIGSKSEACGQAIKVYLPYIAETQDEKQYRVVMDRERWFGVVMGEEFKVDARSTEKLANRVEFPAHAAEELAFKLQVG